VTTPGFVGANAVAISAPLAVPLEPGQVPLLSAKDQTKQVASVKLSIGRLFSAEVQAVMARSLVQQLVALLRQPAGVADKVELQKALGALKPCRGWLAAAGVPQAFAAGDSLGRTALRLAVDQKHWDCVQALVEASCNPRALAEDLRSPLTAAIEQSCRGAEALLSLKDLAIETERGQVACKFAALLESSKLASAASKDDQPQKFEALACPLVQHFGPARQGPSVAAVWFCDVYFLAMEHCPTGRSRRSFIIENGACAALWRESLEQNLPALACKLAVWIGLAVNAGSGGGGSTVSRRELLDVRLEPGVEDCVLARAVERAVTDERWLRVARVLVHVGAGGNSSMASGRPLLLFVQEQAEGGKKGFRELLAPLLGKIGQDIDQWENPTALLEDRVADCPICFETLWTATPTAFVRFEGGSHP
ncbi:unnamed protein product, partial [Polarella glacialis]